MVSMYLDLTPAKYRLDNVFETMDYPKSVVETVKQKLLANREQLEKNLKKDDQQ